MCSPSWPSSASPVRPVLHLRITSALLASELRLTVAGRRLSAELQPRFARFLIVLYEARCADRVGLPRWRGFRTAEQIGAAYSETLDSNGPLHATSVVAYVCQIGSCVTQAVEELERELRRELEVPVLIESRRKEGYRIGAHGLELEGLRELETT